MPLRPTACHPQWTYTSSPPALQSAPVLFYPHTIG
jgi:hypothetical protein